MATPWPRAGRSSVLPIGTSLAHLDGLLIANSAAFGPVLRQGNMIGLADALDRDETFLDVTGDKWGRGCGPRPRIGVTFAPCGPTSPLAQASRLARLAVIGLEAIAGAALVPEDVGLVPEDRVASDGVVGRRRPFETAHYHHPAREAGRS